MLTERTPQEIRTCCDGLDHPEGVAWFDGSVYCGDEQGRVLRIDPDDNSFEVLAETGGFGQGLALDGNGSVYFCDSGNGQVVRVDPDGSMSPFVDSVQGRRLQRPNFPVFSSDGTLWVSESGTGWDTDDGYVWCKPPNAAPRIVASDCGGFTNGLALSPDETELFVIQSALRPGVVAYQRSGADLGPHRQVVSLAGAVPDGMAFDREGNLFVACWRPDSLVLVRPDGSWMPYLRDPEAIALKGPTNLAFGGSGLDQIYIPEFAGWSMRVVTAEIPGQPLHYPDLG